MLNLSYAGLGGAAVGMVIAALSYSVMVAALNQAVRRMSQSSEDPQGLLRSLPLVRRAVLALDMLVFGGLGYWIGDMVWG